MHAPLEDMWKWINKMYSKLKLLCIERYWEKQQSITSVEMLMEWKKALNYTCVRCWNDTFACDAHLKNTFSPIQTEQLTQNYMNETKFDVRNIFYY